MASPASNAAKTSVKHVPKQVHLPPVKASSAKPSVTITAKESIGSNRQESKTRVNALAGATPEQLVELARNSLARRARSSRHVYHEEAGEATDEEYEDTGRKPALTFHDFLDPERVELLRSALKPRSYAQEALESPPPPRTLKYFDLHLPPTTKEKLKQKFEPKLVERLDKAPPAVPIEVVPDPNVKLPDIGAVRKGRRETVDELRTRLQSTSSTPQVEVESVADEKVKNPFYYPRDIPTFMVHEEKERVKKHLADLEVPAKEKLNGVSLIQKIVTMRVKPYQTERILTDEPDAYNKIVWEANHGLNVTRLQKVARKIHANYINNRKQIFYQEFGIHARNEAIKQMRQTEADEEMALKNYEYLSNYTQQSLDIFLRENEESVNLAGKIAEEKVKTVLQLGQEVRNLKQETSTMKTEITSQNESLRECKFYMKFLDGVARELMRLDDEEKFRAERKEQQIKEEIADFMKQGMTLKQAEKAQEEKSKKFTSHLEKAKEMMETESGEFIKKLAEEAKAQAERSPIASRINSILQIIANAGGNEKLDEELFKELGVVEGTQAEDREELANLIFTKPSQLLNIMTEAEEKNMSLERHAQINEDALEEVEKKLTESRKSTEAKSRKLRDRINELEEQVMDTAGKINTLQLLIDMYTGGYYDVKSQEAMMRLLRHHVDKLYKSVVGVNDARLDSTLMLASIEKNFEELVRELDSMPPEVIAKISRDLEKERREAERLANERERKALNDKRFARNLERTTGPTKIKKERSLAFRSQPPRLAISLTQKELDTKAEEEEFNYFFGKDNLDTLFAKEPSRSTLVNHAE